MGKKYSLLNAMEQAVRTFSQPVFSTRAFVLRQVLILFVNYFDDKKQKISSNQFLFAL